MKASLPLSTLSGLLGPTLTRGTSENRFIFENERQNENANYIIIVSHFYIYVTVSMLSALKYVSGVNHAKRNNYLQ